MAFIYGKPNIYYTIKYASITNFPSAQMFTFSSSLTKVYLKLKNRVISGDINAQWKLFIVTSVRGSENVEGGRNLLRVVFHIRTLWDKKIRGRTDNQRFDVKKVITCVQFLISSCNKVNIFSRLTNFLPQGNLKSSDWSRNNENKKMNVIYGKKATTKQILLVIEFLLSLSLISFLFMQLVYFSSFTQSLSLLLYRYLKALKWRLRSEI